MRAAALCLIAAVLLGATAPAVASGAGPSPESGGAARVSPTETVAESAWARPPSAAAGDSTYQFYFGNLHSHTSYSDGTGTPAWAFEYARDTARISFLAVTDHSQLLSDVEYADVLIQADAYTEDGVFVAIGGQEWSGHDSLTGFANHVNVYEADHVFTAPEEDMTAFYQELWESGCIGIFCHPSTGGFDDFAYSEIGDTRIHAAEVRHEVWEPRYIEILDNGWHVSADGSQDNHDPTWGDGPHWTVALASSLTKAEILGALEAHRTYSTYDRNLRLAFRAEGRWMGESFDDVDNVQFSVAVEGPDCENRIERVELFQNGLVVNWATPDSNACNWHPVVTPPNGENYYFVKVYQTEDKKTWSGPVWISCTTDLPTTPLLQGPPDDAVLHILTPIFSWHPSDGASTYTLELSQSDSFPPSPHTVTITDIADTVYTLALGVLEEEALHYWRVASANEHGSSAPSGVRRFYVSRVPLFSKDTEVCLVADPSDDVFPSISQTSEDLWLAWSSERDGNEELYYMTSCDCGGSWSDETRLTFGVEEDRCPAVAEAEDGRVWVTWQAMRDGDWEVCGRSYDGASWSEESNLTQSGGDDLEPSMTRHSDGMLWLVWSTNREDRDHEIFCMAFDGDSWLPEVRLTYSDGRDGSPGIASVNGDELWVVWSSDRDGDLNIYGKIFDGVAWSDDTRLTWSSQDETEPTITQTADEEVWLAYAKAGNVFYRTCEDGHWSRESTVPTDGDDILSIDGCPSVGQTFDGRVWIAYQSMRAGSLDIYAQRSNRPASGVADPADDAGVPPTFQLAQSCPNPLTSSTRIEFTVEEDVHVELLIYNVLGQVVRTLVRGRVAAGRHALEWHGEDDRSVDVASGVYFCSLEVGGARSTRKLVLLR